MVRNRGDRIKWEIIYINIIIGNRIGRKKLLYGRVRKGEIILLFIIIDKEWSFKKLKFEILNY